MFAKKYYLYTGQWSMNGGKMLYEDGTTIINFLRESMNEAEEGFEQDSALREAKNILKDTK